MKSYCFIIFKPDALKRELVAPILRDFRRAGFSIEMADLRRVDAPLITAHYQEVIQRLGAAFKAQVEAYFVGETMMPVIVSCEGEDAIARARALVGSTDPAKAEATSIRGHYGVDSMAAADVEGRIAQNLIHCCDSEAAYIHETGLWLDHTILEDFK